MDRELKERIVGLVLDNIEEAGKSKKVQKDSRYTQDMYDDVLALVEKLSKNLEVGLKSVENSKSKTKLKGCIRKIDEISVLLDDLSDYEDVTSIPYF